MVKTKKEFIAVTILLSVICVSIGLTSIATDFWVTGYAKSSSPTIPDKSEVNYGLFKGTWVLKILKPTNNDIKISCIISENVCGWSYKKKATERDQEISDIYNGKYCGPQQISTRIDSTTVKTPKSECDLTFLNAGLWVSTIFFICFSMFFSLFTLGLSLLNYFSNPTNDYLSVWGLSIWNCVAAVGYVFVMIMWGSEYQAYIVQNIAVPETLTGALSSKDLTSLGFSYWLLFIPMIFHAANIGVLWYRQYIIDKEPAAPVIDINPHKDGLIFLY